MQVFLSEFLQVPSLVGMGFDSAQASFYAPEMDIPYSSTSYVWDQLAVAHKVGGRCEDTDEACTHVLLEVWKKQEMISKEFLERGEIDQVSSDGELGKISLMIPRHTAKEHPDII